MATERPGCSRVCRTSLSASDSGRLRVRDAGLATTSSAPFRFGLPLCTAGRSGEKETERHGADEDRPGIVPGESPGAAPPGGEDLLRVRSVRRKLLGPLLDLIDHARRAGAVGLERHLHGVPPPRTPQSRANLTRAE